MNVLIVDDNEDNRVLQETILKYCGYTVESANNGVQALEVAAHFLPDIIISDILMPEMDGYDLCRAVKKDERLANIPFVFYTSSYTDSKDKELATALGASRYIVKPMETEEFLKEIKEILKEHEDGTFSISVQSGLSDEELGQMHEKALTRKLSVKVRELEAENTRRKMAEEKIKASLKEKELLIAEIYHRTRNNMSIICSLLSMKSESIKDEKVLTILREIDNIIRSMSLVHSKLYQAKDLSNINLNSYIKDLAHSLFRSYLVTPDKISLKLITDDAPLAIDYAIPCGLAINEIITNSLKHAFPENRKGEIEITLRRIADIACLPARQGLQSADCEQSFELPKSEIRIPNSEMIELNIADNGIGMPKGFDIKNTDTLGLKLVFGLIEKQLGGKIELNCENGVEFLIKFKVRSYTKRI